MSLCVLGPGTGRGPRPCSESGSRSGSGLGIDRASSAHSAHIAMASSGTSGPHTFNMEMLIFGLALLGTSDPPTSSDVSEEISTIVELLKDQFAYMATHLAWESR